MKSVKLFLGQSINNSITALINSNYKLLPYIPNGRYVTLDIMRSEEQINTIFDVGANIGQTCLSFIKAFPASTIYSFEPVSKTFEQLGTNARKYANIKCFNLALGTKRESVSILSNQDTEINSLKNIVKSDDTRAVCIDVETAWNFCKDNDISSIDLLKIDTEGYELEVLMGFDKDFLKNKVKFIYAETGFDRGDPLKTNYTDLASYLSGQGFVTSGFYEPFRWGKAKLRLGFCNVLFINTNLIKT